MNVAVSLTPPDHPRKLDPARTFESVVSWVQKQSVEHNAPGLIVGLSGTDSILTFLACAEAFNRMGRPQRVLGLHFQHGPKQDADLEQITCATTEFNWVATQVIPWLKIQAPKAQIEIDTSIPASDDNKRWGHLLSRAVSETPTGTDLRSRHYFPVGARNATEQALGSYSQISKSVSMLPIVDIFKSEVLEICEHLGVPQIAIDKSKEIDCDCGRYDIQVDHMRELDLYIMERQRLLSKRGLFENVSMPVLNKLAPFYQREVYGTSYRQQTPYKPEQSLVAAI